MEFTVDFVLLIYLYLGPCETNNPEEINWFAVHQCHIMLYVGQTVGI